jgi:hypothetical protein
MIIITNIVTFKNKKVMIVDLSKSQQLKNVMQI